MKRASVILVLQSYSSLGLCLLKDLAQPVIKSQNDGDPHHPTPRSKGEKARNRRNKRGKP